VRGSLSALYLIAAIFMCEKVTLRILYLAPKRISVIWIHHLIKIIELNCESKLKKCPKKYFKQILFLE
jgi:hypothetical protein